MLESRCKKKVVGIIPARIGSEEIHAKVLLDLDGKSVIRRVYDNVVASDVFDQILIAADDHRIIAEAERFGAKTYQSQQRHICGTDRCAEAAQAVCPDADIVVNIQADEPFLNPAMLRLVVEPLESSAKWDVTTLCCRCLDASTLASPFTVKVARAARTSRAIYFSRSVIPYPRYDDQAAVFQHMGVYGFRMSQLLRFAQLGPSELELAEGLEQLRAIEAEMRIQVIETDLDYARISIDTQADIDKARRWILGSQTDEGEGS